MGARASGLQADPGRQYEFTGLLGLSLVGQLQSKAAQA